MSKLIITADIHGAYSAWNKIKFLLRDDDTLAVAGDLFGTRFIRYFGEQDYYPEKIKKEFIGLSNRKYYVYGNCDHEEFFPCQEHFVRFEFNEIAIFLQHGHIKSEIPNVDILIGGHTHTRRLEKKNSMIILNPGSAAFPRDDNIRSCAILKRSKIELVDLNNNIEIINELDL